MLLNKRLWAALLVGLLVVGLLVGLGDDEEAVAKQSRATLGKIMVPAAAFIPIEDERYYNQGWKLTMTRYSGWFNAPLSFPVPQVSIRKITLIARDNRSGETCVELKRAKPLAANEVPLGRVCTAETGEAARCQRGTSGPGVHGRQHRCAAASHHLGDQPSQGEHRQPRAVPGSTPQAGSRLLWGAGRLQPLAGHWMRNP
jgi:hypothetical protein